MKTLKTIAILLLIITALHAIAKAQKTTKTGKGKSAIHFGGLNIPSYKLSTSLDDNKRVALLVGDTLYVNKPDSIKIVEQSHELRYLNRNGRTYRYQYAFYDKGYFWTQNKKGKEIW